MFDYDDRDVEDYDNIPIMYPGFNDEASSMRWFAPQGCSVEVDEHSSDDARFPGGYKVLHGFGVRLPTPTSQPSTGTTGPTR